MDILSVTTTKERLDLLRESLRSIARQSLLPDLVLVNLDRNAFSDMESVLDRLPPELDRARVRVNLVEDIGPHTKLLPALDWLRTDEDRVVTIDDDIRYHERFFERIIASSDAHPDAIVCGRARRIRRNFMGAYTAYMSWPLVEDGPTRGRDLLPLGVAGVVYKRQFLDLDLIASANIVGLAPRADDLAFRVLSLARRIDVVVDPAISRESEAIKHPYGLTHHNFAVNPVVRLMKGNKITTFFLRGMRYLGFLESNNDRQWRRLVSKVDFRL
jgi:glycosyltransferase involved in cell wall biosynthesis